MRPIQNAMGYRKCQAMSAGTTGTTLAELMIAVAIIGVALLSLLGTFQSIQRGILVSKNRTLALNLCKEKLEILKDIPYARLIVTSQTDLNSPGYDTTSYPAETNILVAGKTFNRYTRIKKAYEDANRNIIDLSPENPDTALKKIEVWVKWSEGSETKRTDMVSLKDDPNRVSLGGTVSGVVYKTPGGAGNELAQATVMITDNPSWITETNSTGNYSLRISSGSHTARVSKSGYYSAEAAITANPNATQNFTLTARGAGSVSGNAYLRDHVVISQVVTDTDTINTEYVELYNPMPSAQSLSGFTLTYVDRNNVATTFLTFGAVSIAGNGGYFLVANTTTVRAAGLTVAADVTYSGGTAPEYILIKSKAGGVILKDSLATTVDKVSWSKNLDLDSCPGGALEGSCLTLNKGIDPGEQIVRWDNPGTSALTGTNGRSWDSNSNLDDFNRQVSGSFKDMTLQYGPKNSSSSNAPGTGTPAVGGVVSADDDLSSPINISSSTGYFQLTGIATATVQGTSVPRTISISSYTHYGSSASVTLVAGGNVDIGVIALTTTAANGTITGTVLVSTGGALGGITVRSGTAQAASGSGGSYQLVLTPGNALTVTANPGNVNANYTSDVSAAINLSAGQTVTGINFTLSPGGKVLVLHFIRTTRVFETAGET